MKLQDLVVYVEALKWSVENLFERLGKLKKKKLEEVVVFVGKSLLYKEEDSQTWRCCGIELVD